MNFIGFAKVGQTK